MYGKCRTKGATIIVVFGVRPFFSVTRNKLPPGPRGLPLLGNILALRGEMWLTFGEWKREYGPVTYISLAGQSTLILNTHKAASDLLDRRSAIYSDRARFIVASEIASHNLVLPFTRYGDLWRTMRRAAHEGLHKGLISRFHPIQEKEAVILTQGLLEDSNSWSDHFKRTAASFILSVVYDKSPLRSVAELKRVGDPTYDMITEFTERFGHATYPGAFLVEFFTWMKYLPSFVAKWKRDAEGWWLKDSAMFRSFYEDVKKSLMSGNERPSLSASLIHGQDRFSLSTTEAAYLAGTMYAAGADTTSAVMAWFLHYMVLHPDIQKKAQAEIDIVVGRSRMPSFADQKNLPYVRALIKEIVRFRPVTPIGVPHASTQDDWYLGYFIPKGTLCIVNVWGLNRDPDIHGADAEKFNPSRHLNETGDDAFAPAETKGEGHITFGFGKRVCVGRHVANNALYINIVTILWALSISPVKDSSGNPVLPSEEIIPDMVIRPQPFQCSIASRSPEVESLLAQSQELDQ